MSMSKYLEINEQRLNIYIWDINGVCHAYFHNKTYGMQIKLVWNAFLHLEFLINANEKKKRILTSFLDIFFQFLLFATLSVR